MSNCLFFKRKTPIEKSEFVKKNGLCFGCLRKGHNSKNCQNRLSCPTCGGKHSTVLYTFKNTVVELKNNVDDRNSKGKNMADHGASTSCSTRSAKTYFPAGAGKSSRKKILCPVVPAKIWTKCGKTKLLVNVALDSCSPNCWINENLLEN